MDETPDFEQSVLENTVSQYSQRDKAEIARRIEIDSIDSRQVEYGQKTHHEKRDQDIFVPQSLCLISLFLQVTYDAHNKVDHCYNAVKAKNLESYSTLGDITPAELIKPLYIIIRQCGKREDQTQNKACYDQVISPDIKYLVEKEEVDHGDIDIEEMYGAFGNKDGLLADQMVEYE
jgi:hypothetical protein